MGLSITVGDFAKSLIEDPEYAGDLKADFQKICDRLINLGFDGWIEAQTLTIQSEPSGFPYGCLDRLKFKFAYIKEGLGYSEFSEGIEFNDSLYQKWSIPSLHLMYHSPYEGYYVPVDFPEVIEIPSLEDHPLVGSSIRLLEELKEIAPYFDIQMDGDELSKQEYQKLI